MSINEKTKFINFNDLKLYPLNDRRTLHLNQIIAYN